MFHQYMYICLVAILTISPGVFATFDPDFKTWKPAAGFPTNITATIPGWNIHQTPRGRYKFPSTQVVHAALKACAKNASCDIDSLNLRVTLMGCSEWPDRFSLPFDLEGRDKYPALSHITLDGYHFDDSEFEGVKPPRGFPWWDTYTYEWAEWVASGRVQSWWKWRQMPPSQHLKTNAELWADAMDWSRVKSVGLSDLNATGFMKHIAPRLVELEEVRLGDVRSCEVPQWLVKFPPLKKLAWTAHCSTDQAVLQSLLERHGPTLEELEIHSTWMLRGGPFMSTSSINMIAKMAPNLKKLAVAIERNGTWPFETLEAIANITHLETAEIWMELLTEEAYQMKDSPHRQYIPFEYSIPVNVSIYQEPVLDADNVKEVWDFMKAESGGRLQSVKLMAGDFQRPWDGPIYIDEWYEQLREAWICDVTNATESCRRIDREHGVIEQQEERDFRLLYPVEQDTSEMEPVIDPLNAVDAEEQAELEN